MQGHVLHIWGSLYHENVVAGIGKGNSIIGRPVRKFMLDQYPKGFKTKLLWEVD